MKKLHPRFRNEETEDEYEEDEEGILIYQSQDEDTESGNTESEEVDPRWEALQKLKGKQ